MWSKVEINYLLDNYKTMELTIIADNLGKDIRDVRGQLSKLIKGIPWEPEEDEELIRLYNEDKSLYSISLTINRSIGAINGRLEALKKEGLLKRSEPVKEVISLPKLKGDEYFHEYFINWAESYKKNEVTRTTYSKYIMTYKRLRELAPTLTLKQLDRKAYQQVIDDYAETHEKQTTNDFHTQLKACINDALHEGDIIKNPCYKISMSGKNKTLKKNKFLGEQDLSLLIKQLDLSQLNADWMIYIAAMTGARFSEILGLTLSDFDFDNNTISINKTWDYKFETGFKKTKTKNSIRIIPVIPQLMATINVLIRDMNKEEPIFKCLFPVYNSTINNRLYRLCLNAGVEVISFHSLRHSHASILLQNEVSTQVISKRLGHSKVSITQDIYLHITKELEAKDNEIINMKLGALR